MSVGWNCRCGKVRLVVATGEGARCVCYCRDCRAFHTHLGADAWLDPAGGMDLWQTIPDRIELVRGAEHLAALRMTERGVLRFHTACCGSPVANLPPKRDMPFAALATRGLEDPDAVGPVGATISAKSATGPVRARGNVPLYVAGVMLRVARARIAGRHRATPFFDEAGQPVVPVRRLSGEERAAAYG